MGDQNKFNNICPTSFQTAISEDHLKWMLQIMEMVIRKAAIQGTNRNEPILRFRHPEHLKKIFPFSIDDTENSITEMKELIDDIITFSTKTGHPRYFYQFSAGLNMYGLIGSFLTDSLIVNTFTYECAPLFTLMERYMIKTLNDLFGFPEGSEGIFCPGGSLANGFAMNLARFHKHPELKHDGLFGKKQLLVFVSEHTHYSIYKMAGFMGIGEKNVISVRVNDYGHMDLAHLKDLLEKYENHNQCEPFMVVATAGTTVLGVFDPLDELADICEEYGLWLHADAAWGGAAVLSEKCKNNLKGIQRADSFVWNPSKTLGIPQQCSVMCVRHPNLLRKAHSFGATYLFYEKFYDSSYDLGDSYLQCGRKPDVLKLWLTWKAKGHDGIKRHINCLLDISEYLTNQIKRHPNFKLVMEPSYINVSFWYIPDRLIHVDFDEIRQEIYHIAPKVEEKMLRKGTVMISSQPWKQLPTFFRYVSSNSSVTYEDCDYLLAEIKQMAESDD